MSLTKIVIERGEAFDSDDVHWKNEQGEEVGFGFRAKDDGLTCIVRCPNCNKENYSGAVISGKCCWCGFDANKE